MWGPASIRCSAGISEEYNDNVRNSSSAQGDLISRPSVNAEVNWPVTEWNTLHLALDAGYSLYAQHSELNRYYFNPGSGLSFDIYVGDWVINLHDRVAVIENTYENPTLQGSQNQIFLQNSVGISGLWDINKIVVSLGYDHQNYLGLGGATSVGQPDSTSENFYVNAGMRLRPEIMIGLESGFSMVNYDSAGATPSVTPVTRARQWNAGAFTSLQLSEHLSARLDGGYTVYSPESMQTIFSQEMTALYFQFLASHQISQHVSYSLSAGRSMDFSYNGQLYDRLYVRWNPNWNVVRKLSITTPIWWEQGKQGGLGSLTYNQYGTGVTMGRALTRKLSAQLHYQWILRTGNQASYNYTANIVGLNLTYQF